MRVRRSAPPRGEAPAAPTLWSEVTAIVLMVVALLLVLALATYHAEDPVPWPLGHWAGEPVRNLVGIAGALGAELLRQLLGYAAWTVPPLLVLFGWEVFRRRRGRAISRLAGCLLMILAAAAALHLALDEGTGTQATRGAGGWFGYAFAHLLSGVLNRWGALVAALALFVTSLLIVTRASIVDALRIVSARAAALARNAWLAWVRHREARRKEALRLEVARRQRERRAAIAATTPADSEV